MGTANKRIKQKVKREKKSNLKRITKKEHEKL